MVNIKKVFGILILMLTTAPALALNTDEHIQISATALEQSFGEVGAVFKTNVVNLPLPDGRILHLPVELVDGFNFGTLTAHFARNDKHSARNHHRGETILTQLSRLSSEELLELKANSPDKPYEEQQWGAPGNYLAHHWLALQAANKAAGSADVHAELVKAMILETMAQGYLQDSFSSGHMLLPGSGLWWPMHGVNVRILHNQHGSIGLYVMNSRGEVWQTFGDGLVAWYPEIQARVVEASKCSLNELLIAFYAGFDNSWFPPELRDWLQNEAGLSDIQAAVNSWLATTDGAEYYSEAKMPSLLRLPTPVAATWSLAQKTKSETISRERLYYPQLAEPGYHANDLSESILRELPELNTVPSWLVIPDPRQRTKRRPGVAASVKYHQEWNIGPSYQGPQILGGIGWEATSGNDQKVLTAGIGFGLFEMRHPLRKLVSPERAAIELRYVGRLSGPGALLNLETTGEAKIPGWTSLHIGLGYAAAIEKPWQRHGPSIALGISLPGTRLPFGYAGTRLRVRYQWHFLEEIQGNAIVELIVH